MPTSQGMPKIASKPPEARREAQNGTEGSHSLHNEPSLSIHYLGHLVSRTAIQ